MTRFDYPPGATPLDPDEAAGLIPSHISTQSQLNEWEQMNILEGMDWARRQSKRELLDEGFVRDLHKRMFGRTWRWAGQFRRTDKNIGVDWLHVPVRLHDLLENVKVQFDSAIDPLEQIVLRFHHRLVSIHAFANGNGRHARVMADLLMHRKGRMEFTWGRDTLVNAGDARSAYLTALRAADNHDYQPLFAFACDRDNGCA